MKEKKKKKKDDWVYLRASQRDDGSWDVSKFTWPSDKKLLFLRKASDVAFWVATLVFSVYIVVSALGPLFGFSTNFDWSHSLWG